MRLIFVFTALLFFITLSFAGTINIAAASNLNSVFEKLQKAFNEEYPDIKLQTNFFASGTLAKQIKQGSLFDIFLSADMRFPQELYDDGFATLEPIVYAQGTIAMFSTQSMDFSKGLELLKDKQITTISIANPKTAPYGKATQEALVKYGIYGEVENKLLFAKSIAEVITQVTTAADIGFCAKSVFFSPKMAKYKEGVNWISVDLELYTPINQGVIILQDSKNMEEAKLFYDFLQSKRAKTIFKDFGYNIYEPN